MPTRQASEFSRAVAAVLISKYKKKRLTQEGLAATTGINYTTLRRQMAGESEIEVKDLAVLCAVIGVEPADVLDEALADIGGLSVLVSEVSDTTDDLETKRKRKLLESMSTAEIEKLPHAATRDPEMDTDEPD